MVCGLWKIKFLFLVVAGAHESASTLHPNGGFSASFSFGPNVPLASPKEPGIQMRQQRAGGNRSEKKEA